MDQYAAFCNFDAACANAKVWQESDAFRSSFSVFCSEHVHQVQA